MVMDDGIQFFEPMLYLGPTANAGIANASQNEIRSDLARRQQREIAAT